MSRLTAKNHGPAPTRRARAEAGDRACEQASTHNAMGGDQGQPRQRQRHLGWGAWLAAALISSAACDGCGEDGGEDTGTGGAVGDVGDERCMTMDQFYRERVWAEVFQPNCSQCHDPLGQAAESDFVLVGHWWGPNYHAENIDNVENIARLERDGTSFLLLKPTLQNDITHGGGERIAIDSEEYRILEQFVDRYKNPGNYAGAGCGDTNVADPASDFEGIELLDPAQTLRKATLNLAGRLPTAEELDRVDGGSIDAIDDVLRSVMREPGFYERLREAFNDSFLTDRYLPNENAINLLDEVAYPNARWYEAITDEDAAREARDQSNRAVAREALELLVYIIRHGRPFSEIVTADYMVVNPWSAKVYGLPVQFEDPSNPDEFKPAQLPGVTHAGVLTSHMVWNRFPTTPTNRNRHRARKIFEFFLGTDIQALGSRPIDPSSIVDHNPTMNNLDCAVCHSRLDPIAGTLQNWDAMGRYQPRDEPWFAEMRAPGYGGEVMPPDQLPTAARWLGHKLVEDRRFGVGITHLIYNALLGQAPLKEPDDLQSADLAWRQRAVDIQEQVIFAAANAFVDSGYSLETLIIHLVKTPYFRAHNADGLSSEQAGIHAELGMGRLLTPELLNRKILATTGFPWRSRVESSDLLLDANNGYRIFYGGIDSDSITERITSPNGIMANVGLRMANEMACRATAQDFRLPASERLLFPKVEVSFEPEDENGFPIERATTAIKANLVYLYAHLFGEQHDVGSPTIDRAYELFAAVWKDGKRGMAADEYGSSLPGNCQANRDFWTEEDFPEDTRINRDELYTVRSWMAVITYLLSDYRFLHE